MRKLIFYIVNNNRATSDTIASEYFTKYGNSVITFSSRHNCITFKSKITGITENIDVSYRILEFGEETAISMVRLLDSAYLEAKNLSSENMSDEWQPGSLNAIIYSKVQKFYYMSTDSNKECDIFDFVTEIFIAMLMGHKLKNGNKRLSIVYLKVLLWHFGYYLKFTRGFQEDYSKHKTFIEEFVKNLENKSENDVEAYKGVVKGWIIKNVIIGLNWRNNENNNKTKQN